MNKYPFPKVDLHFHLDGSMVPEVTWKLAKKEILKLPKRNIRRIQTVFSDTADCGDVGEYLARFDLPTAILQDEKAL